MKFSQALKELRSRSNKSRYRLAQYSGVNESYILRLERGDRTNPSRDLVIKLGLALVHGDNPLEIWDIDTLLLSADYAPLNREWQLDLKK